MFKVLLEYHKALLGLLEAAQKLVSIGAIIIGGIWTYKLFIEHRESKARIYVEHEISVIDIDEDCAFIRVIVMLHNTGKILVALTEGNIRVEQVLPIPSKVKEAASQIKPLKDKTETFYWHVLANKEVIWRNADIVVLEPGERNKKPFEFIMCNLPEVINVHTYIAHPHEKGVGWHDSTILDLREDG